jgi:ATP-dependent DNA helicase PIF1
MPAHKITLKVGMPLMLLRNLDVAGGTCNGTKVKVTRIVSRDLIECERTDMNGEKHKVFIPRIRLDPKDGDYPFAWTRTQFPIRVAFAKTVCKSQGQTIAGRVGLYLPDPCFGHGQLYVGCSRNSDEDALRLCIPPPTFDHLLDGIDVGIPRGPRSGGNLTVNVVFDEVL